MISLQRDRREPHINGVVDAAFGACAFQRELHGTICRFFNLFRIDLWSGFRRNQHGVNGGNKLPGKVQTTLEKIGNHNGLSARRPSSQKCDQTDRARAAILRSDLLVKLWTDDSRQADVKR